MAQIILPFRAEYVRPGRNRGICRNQECRHQYFKIKDLRLALVVQPSSPTNDVTFQWYHFSCFFKNHKPECVGDIDYFESLRWDDQEKIKEEIKKHNSITSGRRTLLAYFYPDSCRERDRFFDSDKTFGETASLSTNGMYTYIGNALPKIELDNRALGFKMAQNTMIYKLRDQLALCSLPAIANLLKGNGQDFDYNDIPLMLDRLTDMIIFGALKRCPTCKTGRLEFRSGLSGMSYYCTQEDEWSRCGSYFDEPPRRPFLGSINGKDEQKIKMELLSSMPYWDRTNLFQKRVFERNPPSASTIALNIGHKPQDTKVKTGISSASARRERVYHDGEGNIYSASLTLTDLQAGKNSYCNIQVLHSPYAFFQSWGEIGMPASTQEEITANVHLAISQFESVFQQQTGNSWANRKTFKKVPGKKFWLDTFGKQDVANEDKTSEMIPSILERSVKELVKQIFALPTQMIIAVEETELDSNKVPLGKPRRKQIEKAYEILVMLEAIPIRRDEDYQKMVLSLSNKFYTLIPHKFAAVNSSLLLDTVSAIQKKRELLDSLKEVAIIYSHHRSLKTKLRPMYEEERVFKILKNCVQATHAPSHDHYTLDILKIFKAERQGEDVHNEPFKTLFNKRLLWHGSAIINFAKILSEGLRIVPPGVSRTGNMFGQGIYFSDMVSKAANYCHAKENPDNTGLLLLCEVTLGHMKHLFVADHTIKSPPRGYNSVKGVGRTEPSPFETRPLYDDVKLASGTGVPTSLNPELLPFTTLLYNEYIVYNTAQVKINYLLKVKFNYKT